MGYIRNKSNRCCKSDRNFTSKITKSNIGTIAEHIAMIQLMKENYLVAKAIDPQSLFDLVAVHKETGEIRLIDVKTKTFRKKDKSEIYRCPTAKQKKLKPNTERAAIILGKLGGSIFIKD